MSTDPRPSDALLDREFGYTDYRNSCRDLYTLDQLCRRPRDHEGDHAAGYGSGRSRWSQ